MLAFSAGVALWSCRHDLPGNAATQSGTQTRDIHEILEPIQAQFNVPALGAAVVGTEGIRAAGAVGMRRKNGTEAITDADLFHIGSCTKSMTSTLVALLVEEGVLGWDTTIAEIFPESLDTIHADYHNLTLPIFLAHRSGIPGDQDPGAYANFQSTYWDYQGEITAQRLSLLENVLAEAPVRPPDTALSYSNLGYIIAGSICEQLTGEPWEALITEKLFNSLGMGSTGFGAPGTPETEDQPWGHDGPQCNPISPGMFADNPEILGPAGRVHLSLSDWGRYTQLHLQGAQGETGLLLQPSSFDVLHYDLDNQGYALGWVPQSRPWTGGTALWHNGSNTLWYAEMWVAPGADGALMAVSNCASESAFLAVQRANAKLVGPYLQS